MRRSEASCLPSCTHLYSWRLFRQYWLFMYQEEDSIEEVCLEIVTKWCDAEKATRAQTKAEDEVEALTSMIEKQAQIVVKPKEVSEEEQRRKAALLAQYANVTDDEDAAEEEDIAAAAQTNDKSLFKNTNLEDLVNARKHERDAMREASHKKKDQDKQQREKDKQAKQDRKEKEKKRTQKGERKR
ncbi:coiled-coil domain-containing protein 43 isoform X2 [Bufo bufo]|uniref:coiled-coil domain-containing protein 43 isoform X2 n=1 Tax=Bufo bufo TaxID=8384 RepID=UPI001ABDA5B0|nr:coiled-coil domain-containing protein 43 isoform X2 [Bufo bufo]